MATTLTELEERELLCLLESEARDLFPDTGPFRRELYPKHREFFRAGATYLERLFIAANRVGKTLAACYELSLHLTGDYPHWWEGRRFPRSTSCWAVGTTTQTTKSLLQATLLGPVGAWGSGLLPRERIRRVSRAAGSVADLVESIWVQHQSGGWSTVSLKSYEQGRKAFEGDKKDVILEDEEPPLPIHAENTLRTMDTSGTGQESGLVMTTFTPLQGLSETVLYFLPNGQLPEQPGASGKYVVNASWDDVPHLDAATRARYLSTVLDYQREARTRGIPVLAAGVIYPVAESVYLEDPFPLPPHWKRAYGLDVGWNRTAAIWGAYDPDTDIWHLYSEHYQGQAEPSIHAAAIRSRGEWIHGVIDPAARGRMQSDGRQLLQTYTDLGLHLQAANSAVEAGIYQVLDRLSTGRFKVFTTMQHLRNEMRLYRRDEHGHIVKVNDHACDSARYLCLCGLEVARAVPVRQRPGMGLRPVGSSTAYGWMA